MIFFRKELNKFNSFLLNWFETKVTAFEMTDC